jgi:hypothetical protein
MSPREKEIYLEERENKYVEFLQKINLSNNLEVTFPSGGFPLYKFYVKRGNNS